MCCSNVLIFFAPQDAWISEAMGQKEENQKSNNIFIDISEYKEAIIIEINILQAV